MPTLKSNMPPPGQKIYHITHIDNLPSLAASGCLWSDAEMLRQELGKTAIGLSGIKRNRLELLKVKCYPETKVGEYVPFYFCPRPIMLYLLYMGNAPGLTYKGGQRPIIHLEAGLQEAVEWAETQNWRWAFSTSNAGAFYTSFYRRWRDLDQVDWQAVGAANWSDAHIKEGKQAEFLLYTSFPWHLVKTIGVVDAVRAEQAANKLEQAAHIPNILVRPEWYY